MSKYKVIVEKEYKHLSLDSTEPIIGCLMMVKNEEKRIHVSLESVTGTVNCFIVFDTGSTDKTVEIITEHCEKHKINLYMIQGDFENCPAENTEVFGKGRVGFSGFAGYHVVTIKKGLLNDSKNYTTRPPRKIKVPANNFDTWHVSK